MYDSRNGVGGKRALPPGAQRWGDMEPAHDAPREHIEQELAELRRELEELTRSLPRHSIKAAQVLRIEELEDAIDELEQRLRSLGG